MNNVLTVQNTIVLGIDIAKCDHYGQFIVNGVYVDKPFKIQNSRSSFICLLEKITNLKEKYSVESVLAGMEPTGHYWKSIAHFLNENSVNLCLVNPYHVKKSRELEDNSPTKNDKKDAKLIARLIYQGQYMTCVLENELYSNLRIACNTRSDLKQNLIQQKLRLISLMEEYFPEFLDLFTDMFGKTSMYMLKNLPFPQDVLNVTAEELSIRIKAATNNRVGEKAALKLIEAAKNSIGVKVGIEGARYRLNQIMSDIERILEGINKAEITLENYLEQTGHDEYLLSIKGVGVVTAASFLGEIGDISKYNDYRQIQKVAGLNLTEMSSGMRKGKVGISKRGRPRLRHILYQAVMVMIAKNYEFKAMYRYLITRDKNRLKGKQAIVALCIRLIKVMFTLCSKKECYDGRKVFNLGFNKVA